MTRLSKEIDPLEGMQVERWNGDQLPGDEIAIAFPLGKADDSSQVDLIAFASGSGQSPVHVESEAVGNFLITHSERSFVCFNIAELHWKLDEHLRQRGDEAARKVLWDLPRHGRLHDVQLQDQRLRHVDEGLNPLPRELDGLVKTYCELNSCVHQTESILAVHQRLLSLAEPILSRLEIRPKLVERFGPLGHGIDVQGEIAVNSPARAVECDFPVLEYLKVRLKEIFSESSRVLYQDREARKCFDWQDSVEKVVKCDSEARLLVKRKPLRRWLDKQLSQITDVNGQSWEQLRNDKANLSLLPEHWELLIHCTPLLRAWNDLDRSSKSIRFFDSLGRTRFSPSYRVVPHLGTHCPEISYVHYQAPKLFQSQNGKELIRQRHVAQMATLEYP